MAATGTARTKKKSPTKPAKKSTARAAPGVSPTPAVAIATATATPVIATTRPEPKHAAVVVPRSAMEDWPPQAELVLSAIEAGQHRNGGPATGERRHGKRTSFRVRAQLRLYSDNPGEPGRVIYTRDIHARGLGFITPHRLPLGHGGLIDLPTPAGKIVSVPCTLLRCREAAPGWFEGSVYFNRDQHGLVPRSAG